MKAILTYSSYKKPDQEINVETIDDLRKIAKSEKHALILNFSRRPLSIEVYDGYIEWFTLYICFKIVEEIGDNA